MGTRHLIAVVHDGKYKLAQYGQWDGYPSGQGKDILKFLSEAFQRDTFIAKLSQMFEPTEEQVHAWWLELGHDTKKSDGFVAYDIANRYSAKHPTLSRDTGSDILSLIQGASEPLPTHDARGFAADSLFCEWAYVIDLDKNTLEVFKGFNKEPLSQSERFFDIQEDGKEYKPVKLAKSYPLDSLPSEEQFMADLEPQEEEEEA